MVWQVLILAWFGSLTIRSSGPEQLRPPLPGPLSLIALAPFCKLERESWGQTFILRISPLHPLFKAGEE
jgi:hypothetical protein